MARIAVAVADGGDADPAVGRGPARCRHSRPLRPAGTSLTEISRVVSVMTGRRPSSRAVATGQRRDAVEHDAGAHPFGMRLRPGEHAGRVAEGALQIEARGGARRSGRSARGSRARPARRRWRNGSSAGWPAPPRRSRAGGPAPPAPSSGRKPSRFMPLSTLSQTVSGRVEARRLEHRQLAGLVDRDLEAQPRAQRQLVGLEHAFQQQDRLDGPGLAQGQRLLDAGDAQHVGGGQRRQQAGGAVAVAVGLDHGHDLRRRRCARGRTPDCGAGPRGRWWRWRHASQAARR